IPRSNNCSQERHHVIDRVNRIIPLLKNRTTSPVLGVMKCQLLDKRLNELMMMVLVRQTEECDMMLYMETSHMLMLVAKIKVGDKTVDDADKLAGAADVVKPRQVDLKFAHASI
nr:hypothetical protein [Tanacetum cinerariifolium]